jgi:hypothetical protein
MLHTNAVDPKTLGLIKSIQNIELFSQTRLVGGTSLALQFGHRESVDIDLFGTISSEHNEIKSTLSALGEVVSITNSKNINIFSVNAVKVDIVNYPYNWLAPPIKTERLVLADVCDIAAMKLSAITGRGSRKDFIDIYFILKHYSLKEMLSFYAQKYNEESGFLVLKSLAWFADAENEPMPKMKKEINWNDVKSVIRKELRTYSL